MVDSILSAIMVVPLEDRPTGQHGDQGEVRSEMADFNTISKQRLRTIVQRLNEGFYDSEAVYHEVAQRMMSDLQL